MYSEIFSRMASITILQKFREWEGRSILPIQKLTMLITFYSPELIPSLNLVESTRKQLGGKIAECLKAYELTKVYRGSVFEEFYIVYRELDQALEELQDKLSVYAQKSI